MRKAHAWKIALHSSLQRNNYVTTRLLSTSDPVNLGWLRENKVSAMHLAFVALLSSYVSRSWQRVPGSGSWQGFLALGPECGSWQWFLRSGCVQWFLTLSQAFRGCEAYKEVCPNSRTHVRLRLPSIVDRPDNRSFPRDITWAPFQP